MSKVNHVFVYGTLKTGQCRQQCWPQSPIAVTAAWTVGELYDLGAYPAMILGNTRVAGQLWSYHQSDLVRVLQLLDQVEQTNQPGLPNEYNRCTAHVFTRSGEKVEAYLYLYANPERLVRSAKRLRPTLEYQQQTYVIWPSGCAWVPED